MISKVQFGVHPEAEAAGYDKMTTIIDILLKDGRTISGRADFGKGSPENPMSYKEVSSKFFECADFAQWNTNRANQIVDTVSRLENLDSVRKLMGLLEL